MCGGCGVKIGKLLTYEYHCGTNCFFSDWNLAESLKEDFEFEFHPKEFGKLVKHPDDNDDDFGFKFKNLQLLPKLDKKVRDDTAVFFTSRSDAKEFLVKNRKLFNKLLGITTIKKTKKNKRDDDNEDDETDNKQQKVASPSS